MSQTAPAEEPGELHAAAADVDRSLTQWSLSLGLRQRQRAATRARGALAKFRVASARG